MRRPTTRRLMVVALVNAMILGFGLPAREVLLDDDYHIHGYIEMEHGQPQCVWDDTVKSPFWPRYRRRLLGQAWQEQLDCGAGESRLAESCEFVHPELRNAYSSALDVHAESPEMIAAFQSLKANAINRRLEESTDATKSRTPDLGQAP